MGAAAVTWEIDKSVHQKHDAACGSFVVSALTRFLSQLRCRPTVYLGTSGGTDAG